MKQILAAFALLMLASPSLAQQNSSTTERQVINQPINPEPANGDILVKFGDTTQVYFKRPFKGIRLGDPLIVSAIPKSDHVLELTGVSPGRSEISFETSDGAQRTWGTITVIREQHEVKLYLPPPRQESKQGSTGAGGITIINQSGPNVLGTTESPDFRSVLCNEAGCSQPAAPK
ncbi:pilus assembly protein N-terminal domain-containing protein [Bradyrhizobium stylosanthis]|uniref:pilus assembly protein N-terminal domain-containing protein n=1 Tax=Bradyrhizobium stylosanthis TaxID=1803665 RepID=UPI0007C54E17|nr:pilus assembly protein N-terminal domain-containing protein [Bradyrhizobium stylosanthis]